MPYIKLLPLMTKPELWYTGDNNDNDDANDVTTKLHILSWPLGKIHHK